MNPEYDTVAIVAAILMLKRALKDMPMTTDEAITEARALVTVARISGEPVNPKVAF